MPFFTLIAVSTTEIVRAYENAQYNEKTCRMLVNRVEAAETAVKELIRLKEESIENSVIKSIMIPLKDLQFV